MCHYLYRSLLAIGAFFGCVAWNTCHGALSGEELLELMKANDAQYDNVLLEYDYRRYPRRSEDDVGKKLIINVDVDPDVDTRGMPSSHELMSLAVKYVTEEENNVDGEVPADWQRWVDLLRSKKIRLTLGGYEQPEHESPVNYKSEIGIRWPDCAVRRVNPLSDDGNVMQWNSIGQKLTDFSGSPSGGEDSPLEWTKAVRTRPTALNSFQELALWEQFSLGLKFADRIRRVVNFNASGGNYQLTAMIELWPGKEHVVVLETDSMGLVRRAQIDLDVSEIDVVTSGEMAVPDRGFRCAREGRFSNLKSDGSYATRFDIEAHKITFDMSDEEFMRLCDTVVPEGETGYVRDSDSGAAAQVMARDTIERSSSSRTWLVPANVFVLAVLSWLFVKRRNAT